MEEYRIRHYGDCLLPLVSDQTPLIGVRLTDWKMDDMSLTKYVGQILGVKLKSQKVGLMKILANYDPFNKEIWLMQLNPKKIMRFSLDDVEDILLLQTEEL